MARDGDVIRLARGLYQIPDAELDANHGLAETAKRMPKAVVCLVSALAFHGPTDQLPRKIWMAIGQKKLGYCVGQRKRPDRPLYPAPAR